MDWYCCKHGCTVNSLTISKVQAHNIPPLLPKLKPNAHCNQMIARDARVLLHQELLDRCGFLRTDTTQQRKVCQDHDIKTLVKSGKLSHNGKEWSQRFRLTLPTGAGPKSSTVPSQKASLGIGGDRYFCKTLEIVNQHIRSHYKATPQKNSHKEDLVQTYEGKAKKTKLYKVDRLKSEFDRLRQE